MAIAQSRRDQIVAAAVAALNNGADCPATAYRTRLDALNSGELPAFLVCVTSESVERIGGDSAQRKLTLHVEAMDAGAPPQDQALDPLLTYAAQALWADAAFQALIVGMSEGKLAWEFQAGASDYACAAIDFEVTYTTALDPSQAKTAAGGEVYLSTDGVQTYAKLGDLGQVEVALACGTQETTNSDSGAEEHIATLPSWKATAKQLHVAGDAAQSALLTAVLTGAPFLFRFDPTGTAAGNDRLEGEGILTACNFSQAVNQPLWKNLQIQGSGPLVRVTQ